MNDTRIASPPRLFAAVGACLLPLSLVTWHSTWPPLTWKYAHFGSAEFGQEILVACVLFLFGSLVYLIFPRVFRRRMNGGLVQLHWWASLIGLFLLFALPIVLNLTFRSSGGETRVSYFFRGLGVAMEASVWAWGTLFFAQFFLVVNLGWSFFRGVKILKPMQREARP